MDITIGIPTKNRYEILSHCLLSVALQTFKPYEVIIIDDSDVPVDIRANPIFEYVLRLLWDKGIQWKVLYGRKMGQHHSHQMVQEIARTDWIFRLDDDCIMEPDCLLLLKNQIADGIGAIAPAVLMPNASPLPLIISNKINNLQSPNVQWFKSTTVQTAEHLYSCFLYKKGIARYELGLSNKAHREETIFSHSIHRKGYTLLIEPNALCYHFRMNTGGIRSDNKQEDYLHDENIFNGYLKEWGVNSVPVKWVVLDAGLGDHWAFKHCLNELKQKNKVIKIACCYPDVFYDHPDIQLYSIAEAKLLFGNIDRWNVYVFMTYNNWKGKLKDAFKQMYL